MCVCIMSTGLLRIDWCVSVLCPQVISVLLVLLAVLDLVRLLTAASDTKPPVTAAAYVEAAVRMATFVSLEHTFMISISEVKTNHVQSLSF